MELVPRQPSVKGPAEMFSGDVWIDTIAWGEDPSRIRVNAVRFTPSSRTAWHSHAVGQILYVTDGEGLVQSHGQDIVEIRAGDVVHTPPDEVHWHGATRDHIMIHLSVTEGVGDARKPETEWGAHVTDVEYGGER